MDLLGSILGKMDAPPSTPVDEETRKKIKEAKRKEAEFKEAERTKKDKFLQDIERRINKFLQGPAKEKKLTFEVMGKVERTLAHEVAETAGLCSYSFGEEDVDRHLVVWKKEFAPTDEELDAIRNGEEYDPNKAKFVAAKSEESEKESEALTVTRKRKSVNNQTEKYFEKYAKILGEESGLDAAKIAKSNASYGMVPSKNKEDKRSIEETMKEIRERKKQKESSANAT